MIMMDVRSYKEYSFSIELEQVELELQDENVVNLQSLLSFLPMLEIEVKLMGVFICFCINRWI